MLHPVHYMVIYAVISAIKFSLGERSLGYWYAGMQVLIWVLFAILIWLISLAAK